MKRIKVEIADTPVTLAHGLMFRDKLEPDCGMLFKFPGSLEASFWGKNTYIPLDVAFVDSENRIIDIKHIAPLSTKMVRSNAPCLMAIEANSGFFQKNGISVGNKINLNGLEITFDN